MVAILYVLGVQLPTIGGNVALNDQVQTFEVATMSEAKLAEACQAFESLWNRLNVFRTMVCQLVAVLLILVCVLR